MAANRAVGRLLEGIAPPLLQPPVNVLRLALHPDGLAPRTLNLAEWRHHLLTRLQHQVELTADPELQALLAELVRYPAPRQVGGPPPGRDIAAVAVPVRLRVGEQKLAFFSTITVFGTPLEITLSELALEAFFPADAETAQALRTESATPAS